MSHHNIWIFLNLCFVRFCSTYQYFAWCVMDVYTPILVNFLSLNHAKFCSLTKTNSAPRFHSFSFHWTDSLEIWLVNNHPVPTDKYFWRLGVAICGQPAALLLPRSSTKTATLPPKRCRCGPPESGSVDDAVGGLCWIPVWEISRIFRSSDHDKAT